jgi:sugar phosphate isomerase/epimerase
MPASIIHPRVSLNLMSCRKWTLAQDIAFCLANGVHTIGVPSHKLAPDPAAAIASIKSAGLRTSTMLAVATGVPMITPPKDGVSAPLQALRPAIDAAAALGSPACYFLSGPTPSRMPTDEAGAAFVTAIAPAVAYARSKGVRLAIENSSVPTRANGFVHSLNDMAEITRAAGLDMCLELQNCWVEMNLPRLFRDNARRFAVVQVSDFVVGEDARLNRAVPGDGDMPLEWLIGKLLEAGYDGMFELEVLGPKIEAEGYESAIRRGLEWMSEKLRGLGA